MGRIEFSCIASGFSESEARRNAEAEAKTKHGHEEGYSGAINSATEIKSKCIKRPKIAKRVKVEKDVQHGSRKWVTKFLVSPRGGFSEGYSPHKCAECDSQGTALKKAKELALQYQEEYDIIIDKKLVSGSTHVATITPQKSEPGGWKFWGWARY